MMDIARQLRSKNPLLSQREAVSQAAKMIREGKLPKPRMAGVGKVKTKNPSKKAAPVKRVVKKTIKVEKYATVSGVALSETARLKKEHDRYVQMKEKCLAASKVKGITAAEKRSHQKAAQAYGVLIASTKKHLAQVKRHI